MAFDQGVVGPQGVSTADGVTALLRQGRQQDLINSELHGRFYEQTFRGNVYSVGMTLTSISNVTFTTGTLGATETPILGVWNPSTSTVNLVILQASISVTQTNLTNTGAGGFVWATSLSNAAISTGVSPTNRKTLGTSGSQAKGFASATALTGLTNNMAVAFGSALDGGSPYNISSVGTAVGFPPGAGSAAIENIDGSIIVPPGAVLALLATTTPVAHSACGYLLWEEVPTT